MSEVSRRAAEEAHRIAFELRRQGVILPQGFTDAFTPLIDTAIAQAVAERPSDDVIAFKIMRAVEGERERLMAGLGNDVLVNRDWYVKAILALDAAALRAPAKETSNG